MQTERQILTAPEVEEIAGRALARVVEEVRRDAVVEPARYLEETRVPAGGE